MELIKVYASLTDNMANCGPASNCKPFPIVVPDNIHKDTEILIGQLYKTWNNDEDGLRHNYTCAGRYILDKLEELKVDCVLLTSLVDAVNREGMILSPALTISSNDVPIATQEDLPPIQCSVTKVYNIPAGRDTNRRIGELISEISPYTKLTSIELCRPNEGGAILTISYT